MSTQLEDAPVQQAPDELSDSRKGRPLRVALLANENAPYRLPLYRALAATPNWTFKVFTCIDREYDRLWDVPQEVGFETKKSYSLRYFRKQRVEGSTEYTTRRPVHLPIGVVSDMFRFRPDVVISQEFGARTILASLTAKLARHRLIICSESTPHTENSPSRAQRLVRKFLGKRADSYVCNGVQAREYLEDLGARSQDIFEVGQALDIESFDRLDRQDNRDATRARLGVQGVCYLYVGHLIFTKGLKELLSAWREFSQSQNVDATLLLAGEGEDRKAIEELIEKSGLKNVRLLGFVPRERLAEVYAAANLFVFPTLRDCFSLAFEEAMAASLPVIGSIYGGESELVSEGENGWVADPLSHEDLVEKLFAAWNAQDILPEMGQKSRESVARMSIDLVTERIRHAVHSTVDQRGSTLGNRITTQREAQR